MNVPTAHVLALAAVLFALGVLGFLVRKNVIIVLASIELMLNAANLTFLAASRHYWAPVQLGRPLADIPLQELPLHELASPASGPVFAVFVILVAAAEAAVGLALVIALYRLKQTVALDGMAELKG